MKERKALQRERLADSASETWKHLPWRKLEKHIFRIQKRIFRGSQSNNIRAVHKLQKLLMKSEAARLIAVRRVNHDKRTRRQRGLTESNPFSPNIDWIMVQHVHPRHWDQRSPKPVRRLYPQARKG